MREATAELVAWGGAATLNDVKAWIREVLAADPTPFRKVRELADGPFRLRAALSVARELLAWLEAGAPAMSASTRKMPGT